MKKIITFNSEKVISTGIKLLLGVGLVKWGGGFIGDGVKGLTEVVNVEDVPATIDVDSEEVE